MRIPLAALAAAAPILLFLPLERRPGDGARAGTAVRCSIPELVDSSGLVLEARVASRRSYESGEGRIETEVGLVVDRTFWGDERAERTLRMPGGVLADGRGLLLPGVPTLEVGERSILFLTEPGPRGLRMPVGLGQGRLRIAAAGAEGLVAIGDVGSTLLIDPQSGVPQGEDGVSVRDYAEVVARIEAAAGARRARGEEPR